MSSCVEFTVEFTTVTTVTCGQESGLFMCVKASWSGALVHAFFLNTNCSSTCPCVKQYLCCILSVFMCLNAPPWSLCCTAVPPIGAEPSPGLCVPIGDSRPGLGANPLSYTSMTFTGVQGRVVHLQENTNKHGGRGSASVQTLLI